jgi:hypothetical protein
MQTRQTIEDLPIIDTKRKFSNNDNTNLENVNLLEFNSENEIIDHFKYWIDNHGYRVVKTSRKVTFVKTEPFEYKDNMDRTVQNRIRDSIKNTLVRDYPIRKDDEFIIGGTHMAWTEKRYNDLFSISLRRSNEPYKNCAFTCGFPKGQVAQVTQVPCVIWESKYMNVDNWNEPNTIYVYQTTSEKWKAYVKIIYKVVKT